MTVLRTTDLKIVILAQAGIQCLNSLTPKNKKRSEERFFVILKIVC